MTRHRYHTAQPAPATPPVSMAEWMAGKSYGATPLAASASVASSDMTQIVSGKDSGR